MMTKEGINPMLTAPDISDAAIELTAFTCEDMAASSLAAGRNFTISPHNLAEVAGQLRALRAALTAAEKQLQPIETAPKDGARVLVRWMCPWETTGLHPRANSSHYTTSYGRSGWQMEHTFGDFFDNVTHWMPLPEVSNV